MLAGDRVQELWLAQPRGGIVILNQQMHRNWLPKVVLLGELLADTSAACRPMIGRWRH
jgi:hypothetical protein